MERAAFLFFHLIGFGIFVTLQIAGNILERQYRKTDDIKAKAVIVRAIKPIGLLSPVGVLIMLVTGVGNMVSLGLGIFSMGWLTAKIIFFGIAVVSGLMFGMKARKRGTLVMAMAKGETPPNGPETLKGLDKQISMFHLVMPILLTVILALTIYGRVGGQ
jgi:hypothetical protein